MVPHVYRVDIPDGDEYRLDVYDPASPYGVSGNRAVGATMFKYANDMGKDIRAAKDENALAIAQSEKMVEVVKKLQAATPETWSQIEAEVIEVMTAAGLADRLPPQRAIVDWSVRNHQTDVTLQLDDIQVAWPPKQLPGLYSWPSSDSIGLDVAFQVPDQDDNTFVYVENRAWATFPPDTNWLLMPPEVAGRVTKVEQTWMVRPDASQLADMASALQNAANLKAQTDTNYAATLKEMLTLYQLLIQAAVAAYQARADDQREQARNI